MSDQRKIYLFDTTLRDGTQGEHIAFSADDKLRIAKELDQFGIDYIEGGWPGSNPKDLAFFELAKDVDWSHSKIVAFGSTCRSKNTPEGDPNLQQLLAAETPTVCIFGKSWLLHVEQALGIEAEENLRLIDESISHLKNHGKEVIYDAEHFFDGFKDNPEYALNTLKTAEAAGADTIVMCDTNGGTMPNEITEIVQKVRATVDVPLGIHAHNDGELAVANSLAAVEAGCVHVQGTINGYGERCGNANLCSFIPNAQLKHNYRCIPDDHLPKLTKLSRLVAELGNVQPEDKQPFVGRSAFAHKGGVHVSAVMKNPRTYEHLDPEAIGNERRVLVSDLSGKSNIRYKTEELGIDLNGETKEVSEIVKKLKHLENEGYQFEGAEASFKLLVEEMTGKLVKPFKLEDFRVIVDRNDPLGARTEATIRLRVNDQIQHSAAEGNGPVHALDSALRKALHECYPDIEKMHLADYKVRVLKGSDGTEAKVRVLIKSMANGESWGTIGVSHNIIQASWEALSDSFYHFLNHHVTTNKDAPQAATTSEA